MVRLSTLFILFCILTIAAALGATLALATGLAVPIAAGLATLAATIMTLLFVLGRRTPHARADLERRVMTLSHGTHDLAVQVGETARRLVATEAELAALRAQPATRGAPAMLSAEISELGSLVELLATSVAAHEQMLSDLAARSAARGDAPVPGTDATTAFRRALERKATEAAQKPQKIEPAFVEPKVVPKVPDAKVSDQKAAEQKSADALAEQKIVARVRAAVDADRIDLYLQPLVTLPQRKVRYYEAVTRLRDETDKVLTGTEFLGPAEHAGLMPRIDALMLARGLQVLQRLSTKNREIGIFFNISTSTLENGAMFDELVALLDAHRALAPAMVLEFTQAAFRTMGPIETEGLSALAERGCRFSIDHVADLRIEPQQLARLGVRFVKVPAELLLGQPAANGSDIHPADLPNLLNRHGIDLVAEKIEGESAVVDLLDYDVRYGQGYLFAPPKVIRREALAGAEPISASIAAPLRRQR